MNPALTDYVSAARRKLRRAHRSATVRFNVVLATVNEALPYLLPYFVEHLPELQAYMPAEVFTNVMRFVLVMNLLYRFKTTKSLADK